MFRRNLLIGAAACAALACAGLTRADVLSAADVTVTPGTRVVLMDDATTMPTTAPDAVPATAPTATAPVASGPPPLPLNFFLTDKIPHYGDLGISITGFVEGSWTYSDRPADNNALYDRSFDTRTESLQFDSIDLSVVRNVDYTKKTVDIGFTVEGMYGTDASFIHSNGLTFYGGTGGAGGVNTATSGNFASTGPRNQADLVQANFTVMLPFGHGIGIEGGKFDTLVGYEVIDGPSNPFFSHSFIFGEEPYTHTGLLGIYNVTDPNDATQSLTAIAGFSRGWDQATEDNNGSLDIMGQVKYQQFSAPGVVKNFVALAFITGDETASGNETTAVQHNGWRTLFDLTGSYTVSDQLTLGGNAMYAWQAQDAVETNTLGAITTGNPGTSQWYGVAGYAKYTFCDQVALNLRAEWFDDQDGGAVTQLGAPGTQNISNQFYEITLGVTYKPLADDKYFNGLAIRPEVRWDYSNHRAFALDAAGDAGSGHRDQLTIAVEAYLAF
jgi:hypothetical protein